MITQIADKYRRLPEVRDCQDGKTNINSLQRLLNTFEQDIQLLVGQVSLKIFFISLVSNNAVNKNVTVVCVYVCFFPQVRQLQENAAQLQTVYAGEKADAIAMQEYEVMQAWNELIMSCEESRVQITTASDKLRFFSLVRDLLIWMDSIICQIGTGEKPRCRRRRPTYIYT